MQGGLLFQDSWIISRSPLLGGLILQGYSFSRRSPLLGGLLLRDCPCVRRSPLLGGLLLQGYSFTRSSPLPGGLLLQDCPFVRRSPLLGGILAQDIRWSEQLRSVGSKLFLPAMGAKKEPAASLQRLRQQLPNQSPRPLAAVGSAVLRRFQAQHPCPFLS